MISDFVITLRETLEAALVVGIVLGYLYKTKQTQYNKAVYLGIFAGLVGSIIGAVLFHTLAGGFEGRAEELFEGVTMLIGAALLTTLIIWIAGKSHELKEKIRSQTEGGHFWGIAFLVFVSILREGIETVLFLNAAAFAAGGNSLVGAILGIVAALVLAYALFKELLIVNLKKFFLITNVLLILFAAGLVAHGVHEFVEAGVVPPLVEHIWDVNPAKNADGSYPLLHEKGAIGSIFVGLFGYNGNPDLIEVLAYFAYLAAVLCCWKWRHSSRS